MSLPGKDFCGACEETSIKSSPKSYCRRKRWPCDLMSRSFCGLLYRPEPKKKLSDTHSATAASSSMFEQPPYKHCCKKKHWNKTFQKDAIYWVMLLMSSLIFHSMKWQLKCQCDLWRRHKWQWFAQWMPSFMTVCSRDILKSHKIIIKFFSAELFLRKKKGAENRPINDNRLLVFHQ